MALPILKWIHKFDSNKLERAYANHIVLNSAIRRSAAEVYLIGVAPLKAVGHVFIFQGIHYTSQLNILSVTLQV